MILLSVIAPAHNEEELIKKFIKDVDSGLRILKINYEILICENGSRDKTFKIASDLSKKVKSIRVFHENKPSYGGGLKLGIQKAKAEKIIVFNIDFYDFNFVKEAFLLLDQFDFVIGSKNLPKSKDLRPFKRRLITKTFNFLLKIVFGFSGTDTHGIKALKKSLAIPIIAQCRTDGEIFDTELVLRAQKAGLKMTEIPVKVGELRPSRYTLLSRIPKTFFDLISLSKALRPNGI